MSIAVTVTRSQSETRHVWLRTRNATAIKIAPTSNVIMLRPKARPARPVVPAFKRAA